jgi:hypothetical protein
MRTIDLGDMTPKVAVAAARHGLTGTSFIRAAVAAALETCAENDLALREIFRQLDAEREAPKALSAPGAPRVRVPA